MKPKIRHPGGRQSFGPIRPVVREEEKEQRRNLVIGPGSAEKHGARVQIQAR